MPPSSPTVRGSLYHDHPEPMLSPASGCFESSTSLMAPSHYKARWVVRGFSQRPGVDFGETFSPVVKPATICTVLSLVASRGWQARQLDISNAFLHGNLSERVYCQQPVGFVDPSHPDAVCLLSKSLYRLKQALRAWYERFAGFIATIGFTPTGSDTSLFVLRRGQDMEILLLYVDDMIITASSSALLRRIIAKLHAEFALKDMGNLHFFLGVEVTRSASGFHLSQAQYAEELLDRAGMSNCRPISTPIDVKPKLSTTSGELVPDPSEYRQLAGALQWLTLTRPDIAHAVQQIYLHMHDPCEGHLALVERVLRYIQGTTDHGLHLPASKSLDIVAYSDTDWAGCPDTHRSTLGFCVFLGDSLVSWSSKPQAVVSWSSAQAEYRGVANATAKCCWQRHLLGELRVDMDKATIVYCDNVSAFYLSENPVHHGRNKHVELDVHFVREKVVVGAIRVVHIPTRQQLMDILTKGLPTALFDQFRTSLCVVDDVPTAGGINVAS